MRIFSASIVAVTLLVQSAAAVADVREEIEEANAAFIAVYGSSDGKAGSESSL